jgi:hypothetical protein
MYWNRELERSDHLPPADLLDDDRLRVRSYHEFRLWMAARSRTRSVGHLSYYDRERFAALQRARYIDRQQARVISPFLPVAVARM